VGEIDFGLTYVFREPNLAADREEAGQPETQAIETGVGNGQPVGPVDT
jgi:hypothetical protein